MLDLECDESELTEATSGPAAPARLRARIMASGYRYHMLDERGVDLHFKGEERDDPFSCTERIPCMRRIMVLLGLIAASLLVSLVVVVARPPGGHASTGHNTPQLCLTPDCVMSASSILSKMDLGVSPCQDMYRMACGRWLDRAILPPGRSTWNNFAQLDQDNKASIRQLLEAAGSKFKGQNSTAVEKLKVLYRTCMDQDTIEDQGTSRLKELMSELGHWTVSPPPAGHTGWDGDHWSLQSSLVAIQRLNTKVLFSFGVDKNPTEKNKNSIEFSQAGLTLAYREAYNDSKFKDGFMEYAVAVGTLLGGAESDVRAKMDDVFEFEKNLSQIFVPKKDLLDPLTLYNKYTVADLQALLGDWVDITDFLRGTFDGITFNSSTEIIVVTPDFFSKLGQVVNTTDRETLANYMMWQLIDGVITYLPEAFHKATLHLSTVQQGITSLPERWKVCLGSAENALPFAGSALFVDKYFSQDSKARVTRILEHVKAQFIDNLDQIRWLDNVTMARLKVKAESMSLKIGFPDWILDVDQLDKRYETMQVTEGEFLNSMLNATHYYCDRRMDKYNKEPNPNEWEIKPHEVNAFYKPTYNQVVVPAGILQPPFYSSKHPDAYLYGVIGMAVGHELTHGFDSAGRRYDQHGMLHDMWTSQADRGFTEAASCMKEQYSAYTADGIHMDGKLTLTENIADNGGLKLAYRALQASLSEDSGVDRRILPGLNYTDNQLFYLGFSQLWCGIYKAEHIMTAIKTDPHSLPEFRVKGVLSNDPEFSRVFNCSKSSPLNPDHRCSIW